MCSTVGASLGQPGRRFDSCTRARARHSEDVGHLRPCSRVLIGTAMAPRRRRMPSVVANSTRFPASPAVCADTACGEPGGHASGAPQAGVSQPLFSANQRFCIGPRRAGAGECFRNTGGAIREAAHQAVAEVPLGPDRHRRGKRPGHRDDAATAPRSMVNTRSSRPWACARLDSERMALTPRKACDHLGEPPRSTGDALERLVEKEKPAARHHRARQRNELLLAAREMQRLARAQLEHLRDRVIDALQTARGIREPRGPRPAAARSPRRSGPARAAGLRACSPCRGRFAGGSAARRAASPRS